MAQFASSAFAGTEGDNLSTFDASWIKQSGSTGNAEIASGRARASSTANAHYFYSAAPSGADYTVSVDVHNPGTVANSTFGPSGRMATGANTSYNVRYSTSAAAIQLYKFVSGTATLIGSSARTAPAAGTSAQLVLSLSGSTIEVTWNGEGTPAISVTDASITAAGFPGLRWTSGATPTDNSGWQGDNFSADEAGGGGVSQTIAFTLDDLTFSASQVAGHSQTLGATLDGVSFSAVQSVGGANSQSLAVTLDGVQFAASQTLGHAQSATVALDGVTFAASQTLRHSQSLAAALDDLTFSATQSASSPVKSQSMAVTLDDLQFYATQEGPEAKPEVELLGGGPGLPKRRKQIEKGSYLERLLSPPLVDRLERIKPEAAEVIEEIAEEVAQQQEPVTVAVQALRRDLKAEGIAYREAYQEVLQQLVSEMRQAQEEEDEETAAVLAAIF